MSENASRDENHITSRLCVLNTDTVQGTNKVRIAINESNGGMMVNTTDSISFTMIPIDAQDENYVDCMMFVGSDGLTYPWVCDAEGKVLIDE